MQIIDSDLRETTGQHGVKALSPAVWQAMLRVPREAFVRPEDVSHAYENRPLPIGGGQTISQPFIVALMTELLCVGRKAKVLEVGTGCGYQAAVLAELCAQVESVECRSELAEDSARRLAALAYQNVRVHCADGYEGWPHKAPYDGILVTAAAPEVPEALVAQLKPGARLVIPIGPPDEAQKLVVVTRDLTGAPSSREVLPVAFVPLVPRSTA